MKRELIAQNLQRSMLFRDATEQELARHAGVARVEIVPEGDYVYRQGDRSEVFYVIAMGEAELVFSRQDGAVRTVGRIGPGGHFGETGILTGKARSLSVRALCDLVLICFDMRYFKVSLLANSRIHRQLDIALAERLRVAFLDQADDDDGKGQRDDSSSAADVILFKDRSESVSRLRRLTRLGNGDLKESKAAKKTQQAIDNFSANLKPYLLTGEPGTGKQIVARQVHLQSSRSGGQYREIDLRDYEQVNLEHKLLGTAQSAFPFAQARQAGIFEQTTGGTLVFTHAHLMNKDLQKKLVQIIESSTYTHVDATRLLALQTRIVFISNYSLDYLESTESMVPELLELLKRQHFQVLPLRQHKEDLPRLVSHYLERFSREYGKRVYKVSSETLGIFMNYDWPGNLTELANVIRRAVMLSQKDEILPDQILLGLPKTEGKWEYNLLRVSWIRKFLESWFFPRVPQVLVGGVLFLTILFLFLGPADAVSNPGLTLGWSIGWPLMVFSFFFLARTWCSVCTLAVPGTFLQNLIKPTRKTPQFIKDYSGWIMAVLCILVFWVEIVWDAYRNPWLTGGIILVITFGSIVFSLLYSRRTWCRYLCPLGAVNAIFAMPSVVELRSNRHVCLNRCRSHSCFAGDVEHPGCPMFRHPYLVDNNRDCIMCGQCVKSCSNSSIQLNVRLAPQELWDQENPRLADSFLIVAMGAIFFPFALQSEFSRLVSWVASRSAEAGAPVPQWLVGSLIFFALIAIFEVGFVVMVRIQAWYAKLDRQALMSLFGYCCIPLILGGYLAVHLEVFVAGAARIIPNMLEMAGLPHSYENIRLISRDSTYVLQVLTVFGALLASLYASYRVIERILGGEQLQSKALAIPYSFLIILGILFLFMV